MVRETFDALADDDPDLHRHGLGLAAMLLAAVPRGIGPGLLRSIAPDVFGVSKIPCRIPTTGRIPWNHPDTHCLFYENTVSIERGYERSLSYHRELLSHLDDDAVDALSDRLGISRDECWRIFNASREFSSTPNALRNLLLGRASRASSERHKGWAEYVWELLSELDPDGRIRSLICRDEGSLALHAELLSRDVATPTGRVHGRLDYPAARSRPFESLAGDAAKEAIYAVVQAGHRLVAYSDGEIVVEVSSANARDDVRAEVERLAGRAAEAVLGGIPMPCRGEYRDRW